jgi:hypothetical protein
MMTDIELLTFAAKAMRFDIDHIHERGVVVKSEDGLSRWWWSPFEDSGQALFMACKLRLDIEHGNECDNDRYVYVSRHGIEMVRSPIGIFEEFGEEGWRLHITRLALTIAAAEIGRQESGIES